MLFQIKICCRLRLKRVLRVRVWIIRLCYELTIANIEIYEVMKRLVKKA